MNETLFAPLMLTYSKQRFDFSNPKVVIEDVVHSVCGINRYLNHTNKPWSVGLHSSSCYLYARLKKASERQARLCLIHDLHEAYTGDMSRPVKNELPPEFYKWWSEFEERVALAIRLELGIEHPTPIERSYVKAVDDEVTKAEMLCFLSHADAQIDIAAMSVVTELANKHYDKSDQLLLSLLNQKLAD